MVFFSLPGYFAFSRRPLCVFVQCSVQLVVLLDVCHLAVSSSCYVIYFVLIVVTLFVCHSGRCDLFRNHVGCLGSCRSIRSEYSHDQTVVPGGGPGPVMPHETFRSVEMKVESGISGEPHPGVAEVHGFATLFATRTGVQMLVRLPYQSIQGSFTRVDRSHRNLVKRAMFLTSPAPRISRRNRSFVWQITKMSPSNLS